MTKTETQQEWVGQDGWCGFCGSGEGHLTETGDETSQYLHSAVRKGEAGEWTYERHPRAITENDKPGQSILWCGRCVGGLAHKYQRYSDHNLSARLTAYRLWNQLDAPRFALWDVEDKDVVKQFRDDTAIHLQKLSVEREINDMQAEVFRRYGHIPDGYRE